MYPYPQGVPSSGNSTSNTKGYFPWSYQPRCAMLGPQGACPITGRPSSSVPRNRVSVGCTVSFSVAYSTVSPTYLQYCNTLRPSTAV